MKCLFMHFAEEEAWIVADNQYEAALHKSLNESLILKLYDVFQSLYVPMDLC